MKFPFYKQINSIDCGPTCIRIIAKYYGRNLSAQKLRELSETNSEGSSLFYLGIAARAVGFRTLGVKIKLSQLIEETPFPCIVHWRNHHYVVLYKIKKGKVYIADPAHDLVNFTLEEFASHWRNKKSENGKIEGFALLLEPTDDFYKNSTDVSRETKSFFYLFQYLIQYKNFLFQLALGLIAVSGLQLIFPFLTQSVVDVGIKNHDLDFIYLIFFAQLSLFFGRIGIGSIRSWLLLHLSARINISLVSDFLFKLMNLPISYFDVRMTGDILQRMNDIKRLEALLTSSSLNIIFSIFNLITFSFVLAWYSNMLFFVFLCFSLMYVLWIVVFLNRRKDLDYKRFSEMGEHQSKVIELVTGMQEIKLHNAEKQKRWSWEAVQVNLFDIGVKSLILQQTQSIGSGFINELKNISISILSATLVIKGELTLGMMISVGYITGQLNSPVQQLIGFIHVVQDAKISLERLSEIYNMEDEDAQENEINSKRAIPPDADIELISVSFRYKGAAKDVIHNLSLFIPNQKITAIVGPSGSGKTTLMKLLLKIYCPYNGSIKIGTENLQHISNRKWRDYCGAVMQEGYIFNDSISGNVALGIDSIESDQLAMALELSDIEEFVNDCGQKTNTKIGIEGVGLSTGQKQRLLIARAIYKNPKFILFDEATSSLDSKTESNVMTNLNKYFQHRTTVIIAHRLSTIMNADQIVVLDKGKIIENGNHQTLLKLKGFYFDLVKNQLELENVNDEKFTI